MTIDDLIRALEAATVEAGDLADVVLEDTSGCVYAISDVCVSTTLGTVTLVAKNSGHFD